MVDCRDGAQKIQDKPGIFCYARKQGGVLKKLIGPCQKVKKANLKEPLNSQTKVEQF